MESSGKKSSFSSPWQTEISFSLQRNVLLNSFYANREGEDYRKRNPFDLNEENSIFDFSALYYAVFLNFNYSLAERGKNWKHSFLKNMELFLNSSFSSPVTGYYRGQLSKYGPKEYIHYALGNVGFGFKIPSYKRENLLGDFSFSFVPYPLSRFSQEAGLLVSGRGTANFLYFLKKQKKWHLAVSSSHSLTISEYSKRHADYEKFIPNTPVSITQSGSFIYRQNHSQYIPSSIRLFAAYYLGKDLEKTYNHDLTLSVSASWKIRDRMYFTSSLKWKDRVYIHNLDKPSIEKKTDVGWGDPSRYVFSLGGSYSF